VLRPPIAAREAIFLLSPETKHGALLLIHSPLTSRTEYTFDLFFASLIPVPHRLTQDAEEFRSHDGPKLCYGDTPISDDALYFRAAELLGGSGAAALEVEAFRWRDQLGLFKVADPHSTLPFDPFSAAFYLVSRYEEYDGGERDRHGRYLPENSVLYQNGFLHRPVVNEYADLVRRLLATRFPRFQWPRLPFSALSTIDVDVAYAYRGRSLWRTAGAAARQIVTRKGGGLAERIRVLRGKEADPYDSYDWLERVHVRYGVPLMYFILMGGGGRLDRNLPPTGPEMTSLVRQLALRHEIGLHPSYGSSRSGDLVAAEAAALARLTGKLITRSRQHFLKFEIPSTYRDLVRHGIRDDYSMGYASEPGFRAGIAHPFRFYDLEMECATELVIHPLAYMDGTLNVYRGMSPDEAMASISGLAAGVRRTGGSCISLWHNDTVNDYGPWLGWQKVFLHSLEMMSTGRNEMGDSAI
jgi:hypothetical protein